MLIILSPAKTLDFENAQIVEPVTQVQFGAEASHLVNLIKKYKVSELMELMNISKALATLNANRFKTWVQEPELEMARQAICVFKGEVYTGLNVNDWTNEDFRFAQQHLRILSGLYGVLRPLDNIAPYRLEMGNKLANSKGTTLYHFWGDKPTKNINAELKNQPKPVLINLASNEYFKSLNSKKLNAEIITPVFKDFKNGNYQVISFFAKKARGLMARYAIKNQILEAEHLKGFTDGGYGYNDRLSTVNEWVFTRN